MVAYVITGILSTPLIGLYVHCIPASVSYSQIRYI